jgi:hypothetical protein
MERRKNQMTTLHIKSRSIATIAMFGLLLATACGTANGTALAPADGVGAQVQATTTSTSGLAGGDAMLTADGQYGVGIRTVGATAPSNREAMCAPSGTMCLEP